jgi:hypothetical protein
MLKNLHILKISWMRAVSRSVRFYTSIRHILSDGLSVKQHALILRLRLLFIKT